MAVHDCEYMEIVHVGVYANCRLRNECESDGLKKIQACTENEPMTFFCVCFHYSCVKVSNISQDSAQMCVHK